MLIRLLVLIIIPVILTGFNEAQPAIPKHVKNFHKVDADVYRCGQPQKKGMKELEHFGIKTIINLRNVCDDKQEIKGTSLHQVRIRMRAKNITYDEVVKTLCEMEKAEKPLIVHCLHGSDRTGCIIACYRMYKGWKKEDAIREFLEEQYGYNSGFFPNIRTFLEDVNVEKLKKDVNCNN